MKTGVVRKAIEEGYDFSGIYTQEMEAEKTAKEKKKLNDIETIKRWLGHIAPNEMLVLIKELLGRGLTGHTDDELMYWAREKDIIE